MFRAIYFFILCLFNLELQKFQGVGALCSSAVYIRGWDLGVRIWVQSTGFIEFVEFIGFIEFIEFVGFVGLETQHRTLPRLLHRGRAGREVRNDYLLGSLSLLNSFLINYLTIQLIPFA